MTPEQFVIQLRKKAVEELVEFSKELYNNSENEKVTDDYWKDALAFYAKIDEKDRAIFFSIIQQASVDTLATVLAVLDGVSSLPGQKEDFVLMTEETQKIITGELVETFLECEY